jgi:hypothetical protein
VTSISSFQVFQVSKYFKFPSISSGLSFQVFQVILPLGNLNALTLELEHGSFAIADITKVNQGYIYCNFFNDLV